MKDTKTRLLRNLVTVDNFQALLREFVVSPVFTRSSNFGYGLPTLFFFLASVRTIRMM